MGLKKDEAKVRYVKRLFSHISTDYDFMNRLMSLGRDMSWRRLLLTAACAPGGGMLLDVGTGTGDIALESLRVDPTVHVTGVDFTEEMMQVGRKRDSTEKIDWVRADAMCLPFPDATFDAVVSGFLMRNVADVSTTLREQMRVVKPGGRVVCLDTTPSKKGIFRPVTQFYLRVVIPFLGRLLTGKGDAYRYLTKSTLNFIDAETLSVVMKNAGLENVAFKRLMFGNIALHRGVRPGRLKTKFHTSVTAGLDDGQFNH
jgi:demethylmenaquinone methyltransferase / 2-methoxy-6-polyprenyl-1,4-benzoquinol methylase